MFSNVTLSISIPCVLSLIEPCGNVSIGGEGRSIRTPFGTKHIPGTGYIAENARAWEKSFSAYTVYAVGVGACVYVLANVAIPSKRGALVRRAKDIFAGRLTGDDLGVTREEAAEDLRDRIDVKSSNFIAPGNIYRVLAVTQLGKVSVSKCGGTALKALICAWMQFFIPYKIASDVLHQWHFHGVKSPLWFLANAMHFGMMFASLGSICYIFAGKCRESILNGAEANFYILTHKEKTPVAAEQGADEERTSLLDVDGAGSAAPATVAPEWLTRANEYWWCCLSMAMNLVMSVILFAAFFLKIATFSGRMDEVATVAVSLYFVFELDDKIMESDPRIRREYRAAVLRQTEELDYKPTWLLAVAGLSASCMSLLTPLALAMVVLISWKSDELVIGGDPF